jgi:ATP-dependent Clp protease protease subunit
VDKYMSILVPYVIEQTDRGERGMDIYSRLLRDRIIFLGTPIDDAVANTIIAQLLLLTSEDAEADISMYINSPGGSVSAGLAVYDTMQYVPNDVATTCVGLAASMGSVILAGGSKGKRSALPHSTILLHQPSQGFDGFVQAADLQIRAHEIGKVRERIDEIFVQATGQPAERIHADSDRDFYLTAEEAREYGLIDQIVTPRSATVGTPEDGTES